MEDLILKILGTVLGALILSIIFGTKNILQRFSKLENSNLYFEKSVTESLSKVNEKLNHIFHTNDAQLQALDAIMLFIQHGINNGEIEDAAKRIKEVTYAKK